MFVWFLPVLQNRTCFVYVLASHLQRLALATIRRMHRDLAMMWRYVWVRHTEYWCPRARWGDPQARYPQCLMGEFPDGIWDAVHRFCITFCPLKALFTLCPAVLFPTAVQHTSITHTLSYFPVGGILCGESLSCHWVVLSWGRGDAGKGNCAPSVHTIPDIFAPVVC